MGHVPISAEDTGKASSLRSAEAIDRPIDAHVIGAVRLDRRDFDPPVPRRPRAAGFLRGGRETPIGEALPLYGAFPYRLHGRRGEGKCRAPGQGQGQREQKRQWWAHGTIFRG